MIRIATVCCALALTLLPASVGHAVTGPAPGECYARADVARDTIDITSKVDCASPHAVQVVSVGALPSALRDRPQVALGIPTGAVYRAYMRAGYRTCTAANAAAGIWPTHGKAVAAVLGRRMVSFGPAVRASADGLNWGWVLPDQAAWDQGVRSLVCVISNEKGKQWTGDLRAVETSAPLPPV